MRRLVALVVIGVCVFAVLAFADCPEFVGFVDTPGLAFGVAVSGDYAYVGDNSAGLRVIDVSSPSAPVEVGFLDTPGFASGVAVSGGYAYVADWDAGIAVFLECDAALFSDGFELGDTSRWSTTVP